MTKLLSPEQVAALKAVPLGTMPNKLRVALALASAKQSEVVAATGIFAPNLSNIVAGDYKNLHLETARRIADFFGCAIEDLFPAREASTSDPADASGTRIDDRTGHKRSGEAVA